MALEPYQFTPTPQDHLAEFLEPHLEFPQHLLGVAVGSLLDCCRLLAAADDQGIALLLGLLAELERVGVEALGFGLAFTLKAQSFLADPFKVLQSLGPASFVLIQQLPVAFRRFLFQLLAALLGFLLQLLAAAGELLFELGHPGLVLLFGLGHLLTGLQHHLLTLLAGQFTLFRHLPLGLLADGGGVDQLLPFPPRLGDDFLGLQPGLLDEAFPLADQVVGLGNLPRQGLPQGIHHLDGVLLVDQPSTAEGDPAALEDDVLQLVQLVENREADFRHIRIRTLPVD